MTFTLAETKLRTLYLLKTGEINLKGENKKLFEKRLFLNIKKQLGDIKVKITGKEGRFFLMPLGAEDPAVNRAIEKTLASVFGLVGYSVVKKTAKTIDAIEKAVLDTVEEKIRDKRTASDSTLSFKINAKRADKSFNPDSYGLSCRLGTLVSENFKELKVRMKNPDIPINVEIREKALIYSDVTKGPGGLPCGVAGKALLLLSGGIDSPVAGYMMAKRGCSLEAVHFDTFPYTSEQSREKVIEISKKLAEYLPDFTLNIVPFTDTQVFIKQECAPQEVTLFSRAAMMSISHKFAQLINAKSIITGECLSQVASQTAENIRFTGSFTDYPVFRPLIGLDKEEIIRKAKEIGTFDISILPYPDCCSVFAPSRPLVKPLFSKIKKAYSTLDIEKYIDEAVSGIEEIRIK